MAQNLVAARMKEKAWSAEPGDTARCCRKFRGVTGACYPSLLDVATLIAD